VPYLEVGGTVLGIDLIGHSSVLHEKETAWELIADFTRMYVRSPPRSPQRSKSCAATIVKSVAPERNEMTRGFGRSKQEKSGDGWDRGQPEPPKRKRLPDFWIERIDRGARDHEADEAKASDDERKLPTPPGTFCRMG
jgi:hypothetical protein